MECLSSSLSFTEALLRFPHGKLHFRFEGEERREREEREEREEEEEERERDKRTPSAPQRKDLERDFFIIFFVRMSEEDRGERFLREQMEIAAFEMLDNEESESLNSEDDYSLSESLRLSEEDSLEFTSDEDFDDMEEDVLWGGDGSDVNIAQMIFQTNEPTQEQEEELWSYIQVLRQAEQVEQDRYDNDWSLNPKKISRRQERATNARGSSAAAACCPVKGSRGEVIKLQEEETEGREGREGEGEGNRESQYICSSFHHFQVADALHCDCYDGVNDELLIFKSKTIYLYTVPRSVETNLRAKKVAQLHLGISPYTMARSRDGEWIAVGGNCQVFLIMYNREEKTLEYAGIFVFRDQNNRADSWPMTNSVRFGMLKGKERLVATNQNGMIYIFNIPKREDVERCREEKREASELFGCTDFYNEHMDSMKDPLALTQNILVAPVSTWIEGLENCGSLDLARSLTYIANLQQSVSTNIIGPFPIAVNCGVPSPDGKWIAVVGDSSTVLICPVLLMCPVDKIDSEAESDEGPNLSQLIRLKLPTKGHTDVRKPFSQYCTWNASSTLIAASSDNGRYVCIWKSSDWKLLKVFDKCSRPCLPLQFVDGLDSILLWAEDVSSLVNVGNVNIESKKKDQTSLKLPERISKSQRKHFTNALNQVSGVHRDPIDGQRITGVASSQGYVYVATTELVSRHQVITEWSPENHSKFTRKFKEATREVLLGSYAGRNSHLMRLPESILMKVVGNAAFPTESWL